MATKAPIPVYCIVVDAEPDIASASSHAGLGRVASKEEEVQAWSRRRIKLWPGLHFICHSGLGSSFCDTCVFLFRVKICEARRGTWYYDS